MFISPKRGVTRGEGGGGEPGEIPYEAELLCLARLFKIVCRSPVFKTCTIVLHLNLQKMMNHCPLHQCYHP